MVMKFSLSNFRTFSLLAASGVIAETHKVSFENKCGKGTPQLQQNGKTVSSGEPFTSNGPFEVAIAFLQTGECGENGENCTLIETTLKNPTTPGSGSGSDISLIPPHKFNVPAGFRYENGCDGRGQDCTTADCPEAAHSPQDPVEQLICEADNVNLVITFCE
ncbi:glycopeptide [Fomitiporia mediterranea MF3/22]|uniref:glycopeptide n=1 Tax=Fomitiporia mediterranea (strain MF3/22) TaxID=694068 RepID=UPI00044099A2|nr:glycopeptide [Fomitiporia mediterranea MF3/22]EJD03420.1 glycopeptide [Fomitiporia mediterranea MF3/22]